MSELKNPLVNGKTFTKFQHTIQGVHGAIKLHSPMKQVVRHVKVKMYPNFTHNYSVPKGW